MAAVVSTIQDALDGVLGDYTVIQREATITKEVPVILDDGAGAQTVSLQTVDYTYTYSAPDYGWIGSFVLLTVMVICFFKAVGGLLKCKV